MQRNKVESIFNALDMNDPKTAMKVYTKEMEKFTKKNKQDAADEAMCLLVKATVFTVSGNQKEANQTYEEAMGCLAEVKNMMKLVDNLDICSAALFRLGLSDAQFTLSKNTYMRRYISELVKLNTKLPNEGLTSTIHHLSLAVNDFQLFGQMASKLGGQYKMPKEHNLNSV
jgi:hypothetical protein